jgi:hypothetical protein
MNESMRPPLGVSLVPLCDYLCVRRRSKNVIALYAGLCAGLMVLTTATACAAQNFTRDEGLLV